MDIKEKKIRNIEKLREIQVQHSHNQNEFKKDYLKLILERQQKLVDEYKDK